MSEIPAVPPHVAETLETIAELHKRAERAVPRHQRSIEATTEVLGRPSTVYVLASGVVLWVVLNVVLPRIGVQPFDAPPFTWLQTASSVGALLMAAMVLSTQNRQRKPAEERERLDLHVNLLAEQKLAKVISLLEELRRDMPNVNNRVDSLAEAMTHAVDPNAVADALKHNLEEGPESETKPSPADSPSPRPSPVRRETENATPPPGSARTTPPLSPVRERGRG